MKHIDVLESDPAQGILLNRVLLKRVSQKINTNPARANQIKLSL
jgi:hypothetical protein